MTKTPQLRTFLWYPGTLGKALEHYSRVFGEHFVLEDSGTLLGDNNLMTANFTIFGQNITGMAYPGGVPFNHSISLSISCDGQDEVDYYWDALVAGGGEHGQCGWLTDPFGVSWQVVPIQMGQYLESSDPDVATYAMQAMRKMTKLVVADFVRP